MRIIDCSGDNDLTLHGSAPKRGMAKWGGQIMRLSAKNHSPQTNKGPKGKGKDGKRK